LVGAAREAAVDDALLVEPQRVQGQEALPVDLVVLLLVADEPQVALWTFDYYVRDEPPAPAE